MIHLTKWILNQARWKHIVSQESFILKSGLELLCYNTRYDNIYIAVSLKLLNVLMFTCTTWQSMQWNHKVKLVMFPNPSSCITLAVVTAQCLFLFNCAVHSSLFMFMLICLWGFCCKPLHNSLSRTATRGPCLSFPFWCIQCSCTRQSCCNLDYKFYCFWRNGKEVCLCDA